MAGILPQPVRRRENHREQSQERKRRLLIQLKAAPNVGLHDLHRADWSQLSLPIQEELPVPRRRNVPQCVTEIKLRHRPVIPIAIKIEGIELHVGVLVNVQNAKLQAQGFQALAKSASSR